MATKKKASSFYEDEPKAENVPLESARRLSLGESSAFDERKYFVQDLAKAILLSISARRSNGQPIRGDEKAAVESATELANLLGVK